MDLPKRKQNRIPGYDYSKPGAYFVTICTQDRKNILSNIAVGALREAPLRAEGERSLLSKAIGFLKMNSSKEIHKSCPDLTVWQTRIYDHVIRNEEDFREIWNYIDTNPARWAEDKYYKE